MTAVMKAIEDRGMDIVDSIGYLIWQDTVWGYGSRKVTMRFLQEPPSPPPGRHPRAGARSARSSLIAVRKGAIGGRSILCRG